MEKDYPRITRKLSLFDYTNVMTSRGSVDHIDVCLVGHIDRFWSIVRSFIVSRRE